MLYTQIRNREKYQIDFLSALPPCRLHPVRHILLDGTELDFSNSLYRNGFPDYTYDNGCHVSTCMRERTTRDRRTGVPRLDREIGMGELAAVYGMVLLLPVVFWAVSYPMTAGDIVVLLGGVYVLVRAGRWAVSNHSWDAVRAMLSERRST